MVPLGGRRRAAPAGPFSSRSRGRSRGETVKRSRRRLLGAASVLAVAAMSVLGVNRVRMARASSAVPTGPVKRGDFAVIIRCRGELKARKSRQITAPVNVPELRIVWLAPQGSQVKEGD